MQGCEITALGIALHSPVILGWADDSVRNNWSKRSALQHVQNHYLIISITSPLNQPYAFSNMLALTTSYYCSPSYFCLDGLLLLLSTSKCMNLLSCGTNTVTKNSSLQVDSIKDVAALVWAAQLIATFQIFLGQNQQLTAFVLSSSAGPLARRWWPSSRRSEQLDSQHCQCFGSNYF